MLEQIHELLILIIYYKVNIYFQIILLATNLSWFIRGSMFWLLYSLIFCHMSSTFYHYYKYLNSIMSFAKIVQSTVVKAMVVKNLLLVSGTIIPNPSIENAMGCRVLSRRLLYRRYPLLNSKIRCFQFLISFILIVADCVA